jgi:dolichol-phosphate mannosyltransferase
MNVWIVLPAYNESDNLGAILGAIRDEKAYFFGQTITAVVVDDGSRDGTKDVAQDHAPDITLDLLVNEQNMGLAYTFRRGMLHAIQSSAIGDVIVCMDADNSHLIGQVHAMVSEIRQGRDVVVASRYQHGSVIRGVPVFRQWMSNAMGLLFRIVYPIPLVRDYSCGFRAYQAGFLKKLFKKHGDSIFAQEGFACMVAFLIRCHEAGAVFGEIPMILRYDQKEGASKMAVGSTVFRTLKVLWNARFRKAP